MLTFQQIILKLQSYWGEHGCALLQPIDMEVGAGTSHTATFLRALGPEPWKAAYVQPSRRPKDGRYGENPNRLQHYYQYQVVLKPAPSNILELYLGSLEALGFDLKKNDIRFVEDDWENPTLGAWGLGWEVWLNGMEVAQFTYFQQVGGLSCQPVTGELTYGLERLAMHVLGVDSVYDLPWAKDGQRTITYGDVFLQNEKEMSASLQEEIQKVKELIAKANFSVVLFCSAILLFSHYLRAIRWKMMIEPMGSSPKKSNVFFAVLTGYFFNLLLSFA